MKSGNLNFLEPSGPVQACNGTALPLPFFNCVEEVDITSALNTRNGRVRRTDGVQLPSYATLEFSQGDTNGNGAGNDCNIQPVHL